MFPALCQPLFSKKVLRQGGAHSGGPGHTTLRRSSATAPTMPLLRGKASAQAWTAACHTSIFRGSDCPRKDYESLGRFQESLTAEQRGIPWEGRSSIGEAAADGSRPCRPGGSKCAVGSADIRFPGNPGKPENSGTSIYGPRIRVPSGGSRWQSALPTGSRWNRALPGRPTKITVDTSA